MRCADGWYQQFVREHSHSGTVTVEKQQQLSTYVRCEWNARIIISWSIKLCLQSFWKKMPLFVAKNSWNSWLKQNTQLALLRRTFKVNETEPSFCIMAKINGNFSCCRNKKSWNLTKKMPLLEWMSTFSIWLEIFLVICICHHNSMKNCHLRSFFLP